MAASVAFYSPLSARTAMEPLRIEVMPIIFVASLFAASFPTLSKRISILRIPTVIFFIGKHFGTGVILATAFSHLLDDAFRSLQNPLVRIRYGNIGKWTGLIILGSLLVIFLVEYISTSYVDYLQSKPSAPPTPVASVKPSRPPSLKPPSRSNSHENIRGSHQTIDELAIATLNTGSALPTETTPLLPSTQPITDTSFSLQEVFSSARTKSLHSRDRSPPRCHHHHHVHRIYSPIMAAVTGVPFGVLTNSPRIFRQLGMSHSHSHGHARHEEINEGEHSDHQHHDEHGYLRVRRRRQVVGLLVLQLGIMIHSLVIGLTLAVTDGSDFMSLTTAILFHQLFEGLSLGIRIASLPPKDLESHIAVEDEETFTTSFQPTCVSSSITANADSDPGAPSNSRLPQQSSRTTTNNYSSQTIGGGIRPLDSGLRTLREPEFQWLKPTLSILFAVTTPLGMCVGMILWKDESDSTQMLLIKGTMSAISAGMLIYAATVEMIAGDFVFGDVDGGHGHGHEHLPLADPHQRSGITRLENYDHHQPDEGKEAQEQLRTTTKKALAVLSLFAGVAAMVIIG